MIMDEILNDRGRPDLAAPSTGCGPHVAFTGLSGDSGVSELAAPEKLDFLWHCNDIQHAAVRFADTKACAAMLLSGGLVASAYQAPGAGKFVASGMAGAVSVAMLAVAGLAFLVTVVSVAMAIRPRYVGAGRHRGFLFYRDICGRDVDAFTRLVADANPNDLAEELAADIWRVAFICRCKFPWVDRATSAATCSGVASILFHFFATLATA
jgi:Family of unknown function (DUF5706)